MRMKCRLLVLLAFLCCSSGILFAQDLVGTWQGNATGPAQARIVVRITRAGDGKLEGQLFLIDQGAQPRTISAISLDGAL